MDPKQLAAFLLQTADHVFLTYDDSHRQNFPLTFRVGVGKATYYQSVRNTFWQSQPKRQITIGAKMVQDKLSSINKASLWRTAKEINTMRYWDGKLTPQTLLCHTLLHEYAHYHQETKGYRRANSVHDAGFYRCLDALYAGPVAQSLMNALMAHNAFCELDFVESDEATGPANSHFAVGQIISFDYAKETHVATILRVNKVRLTVELKSGSKMYVPKSLARPIAEDKS
jgi:hypothetical protein